MTDKEIITLLKSEIESTSGRNEQKCGTLLRKIAWVLLSKTNRHVLYVSNEMFTSSGRVDIVIIAKSPQTIGDPQNEAYIWELKAPNLYLFNVKTNSQAQPSKELYEAETQLMHYYNSITKDEAFLQKWDIKSKDHIKLGGVIIGREKNIFTLGRIDEELGKRLALEAYEIRENCFYKFANITLWTWDQVVENAISYIGSHLDFIGDLTSPTKQIITSGSPLTIG